MLGFASFLLGGKRLLGSLLSWLGKLSWSQLLCLALAGLSLLFYLQRNDARSDAARWEKQYHGIRAELERISTQKNEQQAETGRNIAKAKDRIVIVERDAKRVEAAPLPGGCRSPQEILQADL